MVWLELAGLALLLLVTRMVARLVIDWRNNMALGQQILDAVNALNTKVDAYVAAAQQHIVAPADAQAILGAIQAESDKVDAATAALPPTP